MEHKRTPGPWRFYTEPQPNGCPIVGSGGLMVAQLAHSINYPEQRDTAIANARLIAASPELLAELRHAHQIILNAVAIMTPEQLSAWAQDNERDGCGGGGATRYHERAEIIAKATGSQS